MSIDTPTVCAFLAALDAEEHWRDVAGWPGYSVSSWGQVKGPRGILTPASPSSYPFVSLSREGVVTNARVHILVAHAFLGPSPFAGAEVAHNDGNSGNPRIGNLRWASKVENQADRVRHGTDIRGSRVFGSKLVETDIPVIRTRLRSGERFPSIANDFGVSVSTIHLISVGRTWKHV